MQMTHSATGRLFARFCGHVAPRFRVRIKAHSSSQAITVEPDGSGPA